MNYEHGRACDAWRRIGWAGAFAAAFAAMCSLLGSTQDASLEVFQAVYLIMLPLGVAVAVASSERPASTLHERWCLRARFFAKLYTIIIAAGVVPFLLASKAGGFGSEINAEAWFAGIIIGGLAFAKLAAIVFRPQP